MHLQDQPRQLTQAAERKILECQLWLRIIVCSLHHDSGRDVGAQALGSFDGRTVSLAVERVCGAKGERSSATAKQRSACEEARHVVGAGDHGDPDDRR